jgi:hypothetical protein
MDCWVTMPLARRWTAKLRASAAVASRRVDKSRVQKQPLFSHWSARRHDQHDGLQASNLDFSTCVDTSATALPKNGHSYSSKCVESRTACGRGLRTAAGQGRPKRHCGIMAASAGRASEIGVAASQPKQSNERSIRLALSGRLCDSSHREGRASTRRESGRPRVLFVAATLLRPDLAQRVDGRRLKAETSGAESEHT